MYLAAANVHLAFLTFMLSLRVYLLLANNTHV